MTRLHRRIDQETTPVLIELIATLETQDQDEVDGEIYIQAVKVVADRLDLNPYKVALTLSPAGTLRFIHNLRQKGQS